jgi:hypothetical protein
LNVTVLFEAMTLNYESIKLFYRQELKKHSYDLFDVKEFWKDSQIGRLEMLTLGDDDVFNTVEIESIIQEVPSSIQSAFERHTFFSQYCLNNVYVTRISTEADMTYALLISGYYHADGFPNFNSLIEVFDEAGNFVGAADCREDFVWLEQPFDSNTFPENPLGSWTESTIPGEFAIWSTERASRIERDESITRLIMPWTGQSS